MFLGIQNAPRKVLLEQHLPLIRSALEELKAGPENYVHKKASYWDDFCLAKFLEGSCLRFVAFPDKDAVLDPNEVVSYNKEEATKAALEALKLVIENGPKIQLDHHLVYFARECLFRVFFSGSGVNARACEF